MWRLQGGSYIPGFSGQAFGAGLQRDVTKTRKDQAKKAAALNKYMSKRGAMGKWGGKIASGLLGAALGSTMGPVGLMLAKAGGAGIGSLIGGSKMLAGEGPSMKPGAGTGLLGSTYEQLGEAKGGIDEAMRGQAMGAAGSQLMSGLTGMAGSELKSGFGKMLAGKGINIGASPELGGGLSADAKAFHESMGPSSALDTLSKSISPDSSGTNIGAGFGLPQASQFGLGSDLDLTSNLTSDASYTGDIYGGVGPFRSQQGGYMKGYQQGGEARGALMRAFEAADLNRDKIMGEAKLRNREQSRNDMTSGILQGLSNTPMKDNAPMVDMDRILAMSKIKQGMSPEEREKVDLGYASIVPPTPRSRHERIKERNKNLREEFGNDWGAVSDTYSFQQLRDMIPKYQMGGMMPGGVSNALPYQQGGEAEEDQKRVDNYYNMQRLARYMGEDPSLSQEKRYSILDMMGPEFGGDPISKDEEEYNLWALKSRLANYMVEDTTLSPEKRSSIYDTMGPEYSGVWPESKQMGGSISPYNLGGSVTQQPMAYQLGGLLKYKRSPMMG